MRNSAWSNENLTPDQLRACIIADNRLAENAGWDNEILAIELQHLFTLDNFDVTVTGFEIPEIDLILLDASKQAATVEPIEFTDGPFDYSAG